MRWPGRVLEAGERPPGAILAFVADQIDVPTTAFDDYARRDETRRAHLADLMQRLGYTAFERHPFRAIVAFAMTVAPTAAQPLMLAGTVIDALRRRGSDVHKSDMQSLSGLSYAGFCLQHNNHP